MKKLMFLFYFIFIGGLAYANLSNTYVPVTKNGAANPPTTQNGSIIDTGTSSGFGNVGIGSTNPGAQLDVQGTGRFSNSVVVGTGAATLTGDSNGNVGVGQASPGQKLDVNGTVKATNFSGAGTSLTGVAASLTAGNVTTNANLTGPITSSGNATSIAAQTGTGTTFAMQAGPNFTGNVGVGSTNPGATLDVFGTFRAINAGNPFTVTGANVGIGSLTPGQALDVQGTARFSQQVIISGITTDAGKTDATICEDTTVHQLYSGSGTLGICLGTSSARYKHDINSLEEGLDEITKLHPVTFFYNNNYGDNGARLQYGLIAEQVVSILPRLVALDNSNKPNSVDLLGMVPVLINAVQEQQKEIIILVLLLAVYGIAMIILFRKK